MPPFDPYHLWLGIAPNEQPASYFRLLGLSEDETGTEVIVAAAARQYQFVRSYANGEHDADARRIMQEIITARNVLRDPGQRSVYVQGLKLSSASSARLRPPPPTPVAGPATWMEDEPSPAGNPNFDFNSYDNPFAEQNRDRWQPSQETVSDTGPVFGDGPTQVDQPRKKKSAKPSKGGQRRSTAFELDVAPTMRRPKKSASMTTAAVFIGANVVLAVVYFAFIRSSEPAVARPAPSALASAPRVSQPNIAPSFPNSPSTPSPSIPAPPETPPISTGAKESPKPSQEDEFSFPAGRNPSTPRELPESDANAGRDGETDAVERPTRLAPTEKDGDKESASDDEAKASVSASLLTRDGKDFVKMDDEELPIADFRKKSQYVWRENLTSTPAGKPVFIEGQMGPTRGTKQDIALTHMGKTTPLIAAFSKEELPPKMKKLTREGRVGWYYGVFVDPPNNTPAFESVKTGFRDEGEAEDITFRDVKREFILLAADDAGDPKAMKKIQFNANYPRENIDVSDPIQATVTIANDNQMPMVDLVVAVHVHLAHNVPAPNNHLGTKIIFIPRIAAKDAVTERVTIPSRVSGLIQIQVVPQALHGVPTPE